MKYIKIPLLLALAIFGQLFANAASDLVGPLVFRDFPAVLALNYYGELSGKKITIPNEVKAMRAVLTCNLEKRTKAEVLRFIEEMLVKQAAIEIVREPNGDLIARKIVVKT